MRMGADDLLKLFGTPMDVAEAMIHGKLSTYQLGFASDIVTPTLIAAAEARLRLKAQGILPSAGNVSRDSREGETPFSVGSRFRLERVGERGDAEGSQPSEVVVMEYGVLKSTHFLTVKATQPGGENMEFVSWNGVDWHRNTHPVGGEQGTYIDTTKLFYLYPLT